MSYKHKTHAVDSEGKVVSNADIDFSIDDVRISELYNNIFFVLIDFVSDKPLFPLLQDMIQVVESKPTKRYGDYFLRQIVKVRPF